jgi:hypothetical protein
MADVERARAAWAAAFAAWRPRYLNLAAPLTGLLAEEATVPLDPFVSDGHAPCWCPCRTAHPGEDVCDMVAVTTRPAASRQAGTVDLHVCAPCWAASATAGMTG